MVTPLHGDNKQSIPVNHLPDTCFPAPLLLLAIPNKRCHPGTLQHLLLRLMWWWLLWRLPGKQCLPLTVQILQRLGQHTLVLVVKHKPSQGVGIWSTQDVWLEQLWVPLPDRVQTTTLNHVVSNVFNRQLPKHVRVACCSTELAHPLAPGLPTEPASGDSKVMPA